MTLLIDIVSLAATYAVMAAGFVVVYRTSRVLNLAHPGRAVDHLSLIHI